MVSRTTSTSALLPYTTAQVSLSAVTSPPSAAATTAVAFSRPAAADLSSGSSSAALSLVGALRRLGTRVNLVPVNFSADSNR